MDIQQHNDLKDRIGQSSQLSQPGSFLYCLHLADNALVLAQRNAEWTGHGPVLEQDIAITNIALDLLGQARNFYQYATELYNGFDVEQKNSVDKYIPRLWKSYNRDLEEDDLAFLRDENQFLNLLIAELPRGDWAQTILRQFFFSVYQDLLYRQLIDSQEMQIAAIAEKSLKETAYHVRWTSEWVVRLGDGTEESKKRIEDALADQWMFTGEMFELAEYENNLIAQGIIPALNLEVEWKRKVQEIFNEAILNIESFSKSTWMQKGGKSGRHTEHLGYLLAEMQYLQRSYPNSRW